MTTYEKTDTNVLAIKEEVTTTVTMEELLATKTAIENDIAAQDSHYQEMSQIKSAQLAEVNALIAAAENVGVTVIPDPITEPEIPAEE